MDRRRFLKGVGLASAAGVAGMSGLAVGSSGGPGGPRRADEVRFRQVGSGAVRYRIDGSSRVYVSHDDGATWAVHARFGDDLAVRAIRRDARGRVKIHLALGTRGFSLALSPSGRSWLTV
jgi:hypothetical protein